MGAINETLARVTTLTFDCYGTLIDWRGGLERSLAEILGPDVADRANELFDVYAQLEADIEAQAYRSYREVLTTVTGRLARRFDLELPPERAGLLAEMLPGWPPFADTKAALARLKQRYRLGVLSNIDRDLFAATSRMLDVKFDFVVTAEDVQAYKPAPAHFERLLSAHCAREEVLHVAQSLFHDGTRASQLGIAYVWINRYNEPTECAANPLAGSADPLAIYADLASLAESCSVEGM